MSSKRSPPSSSSPFGPPIPLAATRAWIGPSAPAARVIAFSTRRRCLTSHGSTRTGPSIDAAVASSRSRPRATSVSAAPSRARRRAIARPMPVPAPVTTTCFPFNQSPVVRNLRPFCRRIPLRGCVPERRLPLRRARDASRTKLSRKAVRGSGRSVGEVDESAPGSAKPWSCLGRAHGVQRKYVRIVKKNPQRAGIAVRARLTPAPRARSVLIAPRTERLRLMALRQAVASAEVSREAGRRSTGLGAFLRGMAMRNTSTHAEFSRDR